MTQSKPVHEVRLGAIRATIWPNHSEERAWYGVTITRRYKQGEEWKDSTSFSRDDLPAVAQAVQMAYAWIWEVQPAESVLPVEG